MEQWNYEGDVKFEGYKIGETIEEKRKAKKLTQEQLAEKVKVDAKTVGRWERGDIDMGKVQVITYLRLAAAFECSVEAILGYQG